MQRESRRRSNPQNYCSISCSVWTSAYFRRSIKRLAKKYASVADDYRLLVDTLKADPMQGADLGGGVRKVRMQISTKNKGKSGGARVITYVCLQNGEDVSVGLLDIYDKSECETIKGKALKILLQKCGIVD